jgi:hypothetical protein
MPGHGALSIKLRGDLCTGKRHYISQKKNCSFELRLIEGYLRYKILSKLDNFREIIVDNLQQNGRSGNPRKDM